MRRLLLSLATLILVPTLAMANISREERALIIISELSADVTPELIPFYEHIKQLTQNTAPALLTSEYADIRTLQGPSASFASFKSTVRELAAREDILAIDVILALNAKFQEVTFYDRAWGMEEMQKDFLSAASYNERDLVSKLKQKLRIMYNLSNYGGSHNNTFYHMGFDICAGSKGINGNAGHEFLSFLDGWIKQSSFKNSFNSSNNPMDILTVDLPLRKQGKRTGSSLVNVNSKKLFFGFIRTRITTSPREVQ